MGSRVGGRIFNLMLDTGPEKCYIKDVKKE